MDEFLPHLHNVTLIRYNETGMASTVLFKDLKYMAFKGPVSGGVVR